MRKKKKKEEKNRLKNTSQKMRTNNHIKASRLRSQAITGETNSQRSMHVHAVG